MHLPLGTPGIGDKLRDKASQPYTIPGSERTHVAAETIRGWIRLYRYGGFEAWTLLTKVETSCDRILIAGGANVEAEWEQGPAV